MTVTPAVISLCDLTGNAVKPWAEAGFDCFCVDIQHSIRRDRTVEIGAGRIHYVWGDVRSWTPPRGYKPVFGISFTECTHVAGSGARDWARKRGFMLRDALEQFESARQAFEWAGIEYVQENSIGLLSSIPHIGKPTHYFHPWQYAGWCVDDNYSKNTALWTSEGFVMPEPRPAPWLGAPDDRIHKAPPGDDRANFRSASPMGFWTAVFHANHDKVSRSDVRLGHEVELAPRGSLLRIPRTNGQSGQQTGESADAQRSPVPPFSSAVAETRRAGSAGLSPPAVFSDPAPSSVEER